MYSIMIPLYHLVMTNQTRTTQNFIIHTHPVGKYSRIQNFFRHNLKTQDNTSFEHHIFLSSENKQKLKPWPSLLEVIACGGSGLSGG